MSDRLRDRDKGAPPPGPALMAALADMKPVRTRIPVRTLGILAALALVVPLLSLLARGLRRDLAELPVWWSLTMGILWALAAAVLLVVAVLPPRGQVLASPARARQVATGATCALLLLGFFATVDGPTTIVPGRLLGPENAHCLLFGLKVTVPVLLAALFLLRRAFPIGSVSVAAAVGAAGGALAGLTLHFICPFGGGLHVGPAHAGGVLLGAVIAAIALPRFLRT